MIVRLVTVAGCSLALAATGCGSGDPPNPDAPDPNDERAVALVCFRDEQGLDARLAGEQSIQIDGEDGPRVEFFLSYGEAEGLQFQGDAQGAEQIGSALLFVNDASEEQLIQLEACLEDK